MARIEHNKPSPNVVVDHFLSAVEDVHRVPMSNLTAVLVLAGWSAVALQAGTAWLLAAERRSANRHCHLLVCGSSVSTFAKA